MSNAHGNLTVGGGAALSSHQRSLVQIQPAIWTSGSRVVCRSKGAERRR